MEESPIAATAPITLGEQTWHHYQILWKVMRSNPKAGTQLHLWAGHTDSVESNKQQSTMKMYLMTWQKVLLCLVAWRNPSSQYSDCKPNKLRLLMGICKACQGQCCNCRKGKTIGLLLPWRRSNICNDAGTSSIWHAMMHSLNQLAVATTTLARITVNIQNYMGHSCQDVVLGLVQVTTALVHIQTHNLSIPNSWRHLRVKTALVPHLC